MDPHYHVAAFHELRLLVSDAQSAHGIHAGSARCSGEGGVQRPNRRPARCVDDVGTSDRGRSSRDRCDQASALHGANRRRVRGAADNRAA